MSADISGWVIWSVSREMYAGRGNTWTQDIQRACVLAGGFAFDVVMAGAGNDLEARAIRLVRAPS